MAKIKRPSQFRYYGGDDGDDFVFLNLRTSFLSRHFWLFPLSELATVSERAGRKKILDIILRSIGIKMGKTLLLLQQRHNNIVRDQIKTSGAATVEPPEAMPAGCNKVSTIKIKLNLGSKSSD